MIASTNEVERTMRSVSGARKARWFQGLGWAGIIVVLVVAVALSLNTTAKHLATLPLAEWFVNFVQYLGFHSFIGAAILLGAIAARNRFPHAGMKQYAAALGAVLVATTVALVVADVFLEGVVYGRESFPDWFTGFAPDLVRYSFVGAVITSAWLYLCTEAEHFAAIEQCAIDAARMDEQTAEARLQMLEAQIEPHFLFNTLANVKRLYETDRQSGARMLRNLKDYLAVALPKMRAGDPTLEREVDHAIAYLAIQQIRMGERLAFAVDLPQTLRAARVPALMLLTLVENAVKHGLSPLPEGGRINVRVWRTDGTLHVNVADNGQGFAKSGGGGTGLANIRARLLTQYGSAGALSLALNEPRGVVASLKLPYEIAAAATDPVAR